MELRSQSFHALVNLLKDAGVYEEGMAYDEVKQLAQAMQLSTMEQIEENDEYLQFERARSASIESYSSLELHQSTMLPSVLMAEPVAGDVAIDVSQRDCDSPPCEPVRMTVRAIVHHPLDWSPSAEHQPLPKRRADGNSNAIGSEEKRFRTDNNNNNNNNQAQQQQPAAAEVDVTPASLASEDSGVSWDALSSVNSSAYDSSLVPSIGEMPSGLMVSTSSAAVSGSSRSNIHNSDSEINSD
ncbi:uncharacterized protein [Drosophila pseudoobscura]|uniref:Uncharacterized protein n=1 Tax=Drosophila pseudoobscura pseudoobscura TaxID=46245 RepID=A0A6I8UJI1_DROPS|nr:uncharacterized protein LOC4816820 [Drosophila pseudoobscura]